MVCATTDTNLMNMTHIIKGPKQEGEVEAANDYQDFDMAMEDDEDSEEDFSQDDGDILTPCSSSADNGSSSISKRPIAQALFLNFTADLSPQKLSKKKSKPKKQTAYRVNGVNILNRNNLDSKTAIERIQRRRENHNHVERRRRDNINNTIFELSNVVPGATQPGQKPNKGNILKLSLDYIRELQNENAALKERLSHFSPSPLLAAPMMMASADELNMTNYYPSAPNSPHNARSNNISFTQQSLSVPSSPLQHVKGEGSVSNKLPPSLSLPAPQLHHEQQQQQQQLQTVFSSMPVSSSASVSSNTMTSYSYSPCALIPQPSQLFNDSSNHVVSYNNHYQQQQHNYQPQQQRHSMDPHLKASQQNLRPLLPATNAQNHQTAFLPALRMSGYEKIYDNVCRY